MYLVLILALVDWGSSRRGTAPDWRLNLNKPSLCRQPTYLDVPIIVTDLIILLGCAFLVMTWPPALFLPCSPFLITHSPFSAIT